MSHNGKLLTQIMNNLAKPKKVRIPKNQWQTPGQVTDINSQHITMQGVGFDAIGVSPDGTRQYMKNGQDYYFPTKPVREYPLMQRGGGLLSKTVICSNCGHSWKSVQGGIDPLTCHKCGVTVKMQKGGQKDSTFENVVEVFDPTGISSWDDVYRSYKETGISPQTALEVVGALPLLGKAGKLTKAGIHLAKYQGMDKILSNILPKSTAVSNSFKASSIAGRTSDAIQAAQQYNQAPMIPFKQGGEKIRRADGSYSRRGLWDNIRKNKGSGKKPTKEMLKQEKKINSMKKYQDGSGVAGGMTPQREAEMTKSMNEQYFARPDVIAMMQEQAAKKAYGKPKKLNYSDKEITKSMNEQYFMRPENRQYLKNPYVMPSYADPMASMMYAPPSFYKNGGTNNAGFDALPAKVKAQILAGMAYGGTSYPFMQDGGEANGEMAMGQMAAVSDKMSKLLKFIKSDENLDPWIASKLAVMDHSADAISDYLMYGPEASGQMEKMKKGGYVVSRSNDRKGKTHKVTGPDGTVKYFGDSKLGQHPKDPERKKAFYARHKKNLAGNPYFRAFARATWQDGGELENMPSAEEIIEAYADYSAMSIEAIMGELQQRSEEEQEQLLMQMYQEIVQADQQDLPEAQEEYEEDVEEVDVEQSSEQEAPAAQKESSSADDEDENIDYSMIYGRGGYINYNGRRQRSKTPTWSGNAGYAYGGYIPEFIPAAGYEQGGLVIGQEMEVTPEQLEQLRVQGYQFEII